MDKHVRSIIEDLLPLYNEGLLSEDTTKWLEEQVEKSEELAMLVSQTNIPLEKEKIESPVDHDRMIKGIKRRLSIYQIIFVGISFFLAIHTSLLNESFGFILWYAVLGLLTYLFYKDMKIVFYISFIPMFIWSLGGNLSDYYAGHIDHSAQFVSFFFQSVGGSILLAMIHYGFALVGNLIALLIRKIWERG